jgi:hypothetical protein
MNGRAGIDTLRGDSGSDTYEFTGTNAGNDTFYDDSSTDTIVINSLTSLIGAVLVARSSSRSNDAVSPVAVRPISIATVIFRFKSHLGKWVYQSARIGSSEAIQGCVESG